MADDQINGGATVINDPNGQSSSVQVKKECVSTTNMEQTGRLVMADDQSNGGATVINDPNGQSSSVQVKKECVSPTNMEQTGRLVMADDPNGQSSSVQVKKECVSSTYMEQTGRLVMADDPNGPSSSVQVKKECVSPTNMEQTGRLISEKGMAGIKLEFINHNYKKKLDTQYLPKEVAEELEHNEKQKEISEKRPNDDNQGNGPPNKKFKARGRFKKRPTDKRPMSSEKLCNSVINEHECQFGSNCRFEHDVKNYIATKPASLGKKCYSFQTYGFCQYGVTCLFSDDHLTEDFKNVKDEQKYDPNCQANSGVKNSVHRSVQNLLRKKKYDFKIADKVTDIFKKSDDPVIQKSIDRKKEVVTKIPKDMDIEISEVSFAQEKLNASNNRIKDIIGAIAPSGSDSQSNVERDSGNNHPVNGKTVECNNGSTNQEACISNAKNNETVVSEVEDREEATTNGASTCKEDGNKGENLEMIVDKKVEPSNAATAVEEKPYQHLGAITDEGEIKLRPQEKKKVDFHDKLYLAPLTTVGNLPFRRVCKSLGADITCSEMATSMQLLQGQQSEWALLKRHPCEDFFGIQVCGSYPDTMNRTAQLLKENCDMDFVDINCGCPIDMFYKRGEGCALMNRSTKLGQMVRGMQAVLDVPLTVKMRTGVLESKNVAHYVIPKLRRWGVSMVTLHGRSREQRYTRLADWDYINTCAQIAEPMPLFGNGDVLSYEDYNLHREQTGVAGCMIGRGALIKPWLFTEIKEQRHWDISSAERLDILRDFTNYGLEHWGSDAQGVNNTRRFLLEWQSFLHRYIPVGILERVPQKINEKPPPFVGRDDLETMMASANYTDWIKISEMLLGPVPDGFTFLPKHKANAYG